MSILYKAFTLLALSLLVLSAQAQDQGVEGLREQSRAFAAVARQVSPSVALIQTESVSDIAPQTPYSSPFSSPFGDDFFERFFGQPLPQQPFPGTPQQVPPQQRRSVGQGSGFVFLVEDGLLSDKAYILTNSHVVENADKIRVTFSDGREFDAEVTGTDPQSDVAVIEVESSDLPTLTLGDSSRLMVGEWVVAIGNPFGLSHSLTVGVVSALGRTSLGISDYEDFIQTDAAINPGNSGGPLVNLDGEVIGINSAIFSRSGGYMGVGFAIPSNLAKSIAEQLIETGEVTRGYLGINIQELTPVLAESFGLEQTQGILVAQVSPNSPAEQAGLQQGDIIVAFQDNPVSDVGAFRNQVSLTAPGSRAVLGIIRDGARREINITIGTLSEGQQRPQDTIGSSEQLGLSVQTLTPQLAQQFNLDVAQGVVVTQVLPGSAAANAGIQSGSIIVEVDRSPVDTAESFDRAVEASSSDNQVLLLIRTSAGQRYVVLSW